LKVRQPKDSDSLIIWSDDLSDNSYVDTPLKKRLKEIAGITWTYATTAAAAAILAVYIGQYSALSGEVCQGKMLRSKVN
jgi:hypothetical protein